MRRRRNEGRVYSTQTCIASAQLTLINVANTSETSEEKLVSDGSPAVINEEKLQP